MVQNFGISLFFFLLASYSAERYHCASSPDKNLVSVEQKLEFFLRMYGTTKPRQKQWLSLRYWSRLHLQPLQLSGKRCMLSKKWSRLIINAKQVSIQSGGWVISLSAVQLAQISWTPPICTKSGLLQKAGFSRFQSIKMKTDIFRQSERSKKMMGLEGK